MTAGVTPPAAWPLLTSACSLDAHSTGERWVAQDEDQLARLIAIIAMGQAAQSAHIIEALVPASPAFTNQSLIDEAKIKLTVQDTKQTPRIGYPRYQRDGFLFEAISWIAAQQAHGASALMIDPHISATTQGLDGLMLELQSDKSAINRTTIFEDKCSEDPRKTFEEKVIPAFVARHDNKRSAEIVASATVLLRMAGIDKAVAAKLSAAVMDKSKRRYRAALAVTADEDSDAKRKALFEGYEKVDGLVQAQRVGACFVVPPKLRDWFDALSAKAISNLDKFAMEAPDV